MSPFEYARKIWHKYLFLSFIVLIICQFFHYFVSGSLECCPGIFTTNGKCANINCGILAQSKWPPYLMPHDCTCGAAGSHQSLCNCKILCNQAK